MKGKTWIVALALAGCQSSGEPISLEDYRWEKRVILHHNAPPAQLVLSPATDKAFEDRDLVFLAAGEELEKQFRLSGPEPVFVLIGKDGKEKARQSKTLDLKEWFQLIDTMPMRQTEMQEGEKKNDSLR